MSKTIKNISFSIGIIIIMTTLTACSSSSENNKIKEGYETYQGTDFEIIYPQDWQLITPENFLAEIPKEIQVVIKNNLQDEFFTANLSVIATPLSEKISTERFAQESLIKAKQSLIGFREISKQNFELQNKAEKMNTLLSTFEGKRNASEPIITFKQLFVVKNEIGYIVSGAYKADSNESVEKFINDMIESFRLK